MIFIWQIYKRYFSRFFSYGYEILLLHILLLSTWEGNNLIIFMTASWALFPVPCEYIWDDSSHPSGIFCFSFKEFIFLSFESTIQTIVFAPIKWINWRNTHMRLFSLIARGEQLTPYYRGMFQSICQGPSTGNRIRLTATRHYPQVCPHLQPIFSVPISCMFQK
jgi:hypothetical protein